MVSFDQAMFFFEPLDQKPHHSAGTATHMFQLSGWVHVAVSLVTATERPFPSAGAVADKGLDRRRNHPSKLRRNLQ